jgi:RNA polymerase sigma-70 factor (ECF subfamily)
VSFRGSDIRPNATIVAQERRMVHRFVLFLTRDVEAAEDIAQETVTVAMSKDSAPEAAEEYGPWMRSIARNLARHYRRRMTSRWLVFDSGMVSAAEERFREFGGDVDELWQARIAALLGCIEKLPPAGRQLIHARYRLGKKIFDIARTSRMEPNSVSKKLERLRHDLRTCIETSLRERGVHD